MHRAPVIYERCHCWKAEYIYVVQVMIYLCCSGYSCILQKKSKLVKTSSNLLRYGANEHSAYRLYHFKQSVNVCALLNVQVSVEWVLRQSCDADT